MNEGKAKVRRR